MSNLVKDWEVGVRFYGYLNCIRLPSAANKQDPFFLSLKVLLQS